MNIKFSHFQFDSSKDPEPKSKKLKKVSSMKKIVGKKRGNKTMDIKAFIKELKNDIKQTEERPIMKSALKNSNEKIQQKKEQITKIIKKGINDKEILLVKDRNDMLYEEIQTYQENCEKCLEYLFKEKMKKYFENKQNESEVFSSNKITNFDSGDEISFGAIIFNEKSDLDIEYEKKFEEVFNQYFNKFSQLYSFNNIYSVYMGDLYDDVMEKINNILNPINNKKVRFNENVVIIK